MGEPLPYRNADEDADERVPHALRTGLHILRLVIYTFIIGLILVGVLIVAYFTYVMLVER